MPTKLRVLYGVSHVDFSGIDLKDPDHPNKLPFKGTLLLLDQPSDKPPHGSRGHRILVPAEVAKKNLDSIIGMGVNYDAGLDEHDPRRKVGVITEATIRGSKFDVGGFIYCKDFPEAETKLHGRHDLGMSMELANVYVRDENEPIWYLNDFQFTGATILKKNAAAYTTTSLAASAAIVRAVKSSLAASQAAKGEGEQMPVTKKVEKKKAVAAASSDITLMAGAIGEAVKAAVTEANTLVVQAVTQLSEDMAEIKESLQASAAAMEEDDGIAAAKDDDDDMTAKKDDSSDDSSDDEEDDEDDEDDGDDQMAAKKEDDDMEADQEDLEDGAPYEEPGEVGKNFKTKGKKTGTTKVGAAGVFPNLAKGIKSSVKASGNDIAAAAFVESLQARFERQFYRKVREIKGIYAAKEKKLNRKVSRMEEQLKAAADRTDRRSVIPSDLVNLAAKSSVDLYSIQASGQKLEPSQVDAIINESGLEVDSVTRMGWKNRLMQCGLMSDGHIDRGFGN
jgi:hypothetical protein